MDFLAGLPLTLLGDATAAANSMRSFVMPLVGTIIVIASLAVVFFLINGGYQYMTSSGNPEKLEHAKKVIRNALIGLAMIIAAATLTAVLSHAYNGGRGAIPDKLPALTVIETQAPSLSPAALLIDAVVGLFKNLVQTAAKPFLAALSFFTTATPLMADNSGVFNLWVVMVGITDVLFILVVALLGFHVMSFATFGLDEIEFKHLLPRLALIFLLINTSIFAIDAIISLSNAMIHALQAGFANISVWEILTAVMALNDGLSLAVLLIMVVFLILTVMLLVYYVLRLVVLYIGAVLSPIVFLVWLLPAFKDFAESLMKTYLMTIFVLFVHVVILQLAASIFAGMVVGSPGQLPNPIMSMLVGVATILALLKTQSFLSQTSYASLGPKTASKLGGQLSNVIRHYSEKRSSRSGSGSGDKWPEGLSRGGVDRTGGGQPKSMFGKSSTVVLDRGNGRSASSRNQSSVQNNRTTNNYEAPRTPKKTGTTRVAPKIGKADK